MSRTITFGIIGGYGATGSAAVSELFKSCDGEILIGGRDLTKGTASAAKFGLTSISNKRAKLQER
jgi:predicted dinucleotide-binding enzyme